MYVKSSLLFIVLIFCSTSALFAQNNAVKDMQSDAQKKITIDDTSHNAWRTGGIASLNISQAALSHWAAGGDNSSFALTALFNGYASYNKGKNMWNNLLDMAYGYTKTTSTGLRKSDDHFYFTSQYGREISDSGKWYYSGLFDFKTQFSNGYLYNSDGTATFHSAFFSPAYVLLSLGIAYKPVPYFNIFLSPITERWTIVSNDSLAVKQLYAPTTHRIYNQIGAFMTANFNKDLSKSIHFTSQLQLFSDYKHNPQNIAVYWTNLLSMKINKFLATTIALNMIYDDNVKFPTSYGTQVAHLQLQELLGIGLSYKF